MNNNNYDNNIYTYKTEAICRRFIKNKKTLVSTSIK